MPQSGSLGLGGNQHRIYDIGPSPIAFALADAGKVTGYAKLDLDGSGWPMLDGINGPHLGLAAAGVEYAYVDRQGLTAIAASRAPAFVALGAAPTLTGSCTTGAQVGGNTAGSFTFTGACSAGTVVMHFSTPAPNGWACKVQDMTTPANALSQTAYTATSATISGTAANADQTTFLCEAF